MTDHEWARTGFVEGRDARGRVLIRTRRSPDSALARIDQVVGVARPRGPKVEHVSGTVIAVAETVHLVWVEPDPPEHPPTEALVHLELAAAHLDRAAEMVRHDPGLADATLGIVSSLRRYIADQEAAEHRATLPVAVAHYVPDIDADCAPEAP